MEEFTKVNMLIIKKKVVGIKFIKMEICMLVSIIKIKNMEKAHSFGLVYAKIQPLNKLIKRFNNIKDYGGVDYQMVKANIKNAIVSFIYIQVIFIQANIEMG